MATTTAVTAAAGAWTLAYTAAGTVSGIVQPVQGRFHIMMRIGASAVIGDALTAAAELVTAGEARQVTLASGDKVFVRPVGDEAVSVIVRL
jgi:hypothetical protein